MFDWREFAACLGTDPELFFPVAEPGSEAFEAQARPARALCAACPVRAQCLAQGLGEDYGIWGGLDPVQRRTLRELDRAPAVRLTA